MRKLGLIGGMSWVSTAMYYQAINKAMAKRVGGMHSAPLLIESHDFAPIAQRMAADDWDGCAEVLAASARRLEAAGAEALMLCSNTVHRVYNLVAAEVAVPILHVGDVIAQRLAKDGVTRAGLLGTRSTMYESSYRERIEREGIALQIPDAASAAEVDRIIFEELVRGQVTRNSERFLKTCVTQLAKARNQAVLLGCTELVLLVDPGSSMLPVYDSTALHAQAAVEWIFADDEASTQRIQSARKTAAAA